MDRGRCGYDLVGNKFLREKALTHKRSVHLERLEKIKTRQPGTSSTLDNKTPESLLNNKFAKNPRKFKKKTERNLTIQRENKVLLQRISNILTAPPHITDKDYKEMKNLMHSVDHVEEWNKKLQNKRSKIFFERVRNTAPYYHPHEWESDYQKQLEGQKFMRQVTYSRPKDWVDPFAQSDPSPTNVSLASHKARPSTVCSSSPSRHSIASSRGGKSSHVSRLKILKQSQSAASAFSRAASREETLGEGNLEDEIKRNFTDLGDDHEDLADIYEEDEFDDHSLEVDHLLAQCTRKIFVNVLDDPVVTQSRPVMRRDSSCRTMIVPSTQSPSPSQLQQQQSSSNSDSSAPNTPTQTTESGRRTFTSSSSRRNLFADIHQAHQSFRSIPSFHHTNSTPLSAAAGNGGPAAPILNVSQFKQTSNSIRYEISVEIRCSLTENNLLLLEILGVDDKSVHAELEFHPYDLIGKSPKPSSPTHDDSGGDGGVTSTSTNTIIPTQHDHVPYNWTFPNDRTLQVNLGLGIVQGIQLCVRGGQEYLIALPDPTTLVFEVDPETEKTGQEGDGQAYSDQDALKILQGLLSANSLPSLLPLTDATLEFDPISVSASALIPMEVFYPIISSPVRQISGLTRQKTGWNEIKTQFLFKPENIGMLLKVKRISEEKAIISGLVVRDSINRFINPMTRKSTPAISRDSNLEITISMPSILCIDNELITDYFRNAVNYIRIKHNGTTGENKLVFEE